MTFTKAGSSFIRSMKASSLRKNFSWIFLANLAYSLCQWGVITFLVRLGSPEKVGQYSIALAIVVPVSTFSNLQLGAILMTDAKGTFRPQEYLALRLTTTIASLAFLVAFVMVFHLQVNVAVAVIILGIGMGADAIADILFSNALRSEHMTIVASGRLFNGIASLLLLAFAFWLTRSVEWALAGSALGSVATLCFFALPAGKVSSEISVERRSISFASIRPEWNWTRLRQLTVLAAPMGIALLVTALNTNIPRYFVQNRLGTSSLGVYSTLAYIALLGNTIVSSLGLVASPRLSNLFADGNINAFRRMLTALILLGIGMGAVQIIVSITLGSTLVSYAFGAEYASYSSTLVILMISGALLYIVSFLGVTITAMRLFRQNMIVNLAMLVTVTLGSFVLVPRWGITGAAFVGILSGITAILGFTVVVIRHGIIDIRFGSQPQREWIADRTGADSTEYVTRG